MSRQDRYKQYYKGAYYHVFNRGINKNNIFLDDYDFYFYLRKLREFKERDEIRFITYTLMPNHIHFLLKQESDKPISKFIQSLHTSYGHYFNRKYKRIGPLFQDRFKMRIINKNEYLLWVSAYIHLNAKLAGLVIDPADYQWSSYLDYIGKRNGTLCDKRIILNQFNGCKEYQDFVEKNFEKMEIKKKIEKLIFE